MLKGGGDEAVGLLGDDEALHGNGKAVGEALKNILCSQT